MSARTDSPTQPPGYIFDLDGTLIDSLADITAGVRFVLGPAAGVQPDQVRPLVSLGATDMFRRLTGRDDPGQLAELVARYRRYYAEHDLDATTLFPGWSATLDELTNRGAPLAVLSNKPDIATKHICRALLGRWPFVCFAGLADGWRAKPDPARALAICGDMKRDPAEVLFVGDSHIDMQTAARGGMVPVGAVWGFHDAAELLGGGARVVVHQPGDLLALRP